MSIHGKSNDPDHHSFSIYKPFTKRQSSAIAITLSNRSQLNPWKCPPLHPKRLERAFGLLSIDICWKRVISNYARVRLCTLLFSVNRNLGDVWCVRTHTQRWRFNFNCFRCKYLHIARWNSKNFIYGGKLWLIPEMEFRARNDSEINIRMGKEWPHSKGNYILCISQSSILLKMRIKAGRKENIMHKNNCSCKPSKCRSITLTWFVRAGFHLSNSNHCTNNKWLPERYHMATEKNKFLIFNPITFNFM